MIMQEHRWLGEHPENRVLYIRTRQQTEEGCLLNITVAILVLREPNRLFQQMSSQLQHQPTGFTPKVWSGNKPPPRVVDNVQ